MASAGMVVPGWQELQQFKRRDFLQDAPQYQGTATGGLQTFAGGGASPAAGFGFGDQQSAMDKFFQLKQAATLQQVGKRADNLAAARGMHIDGGVSTQMEQELANDALGQLNQQQAGANADLMAQQRAYAMERERMRAAEQQQQWDRQWKEKLYRDMQQGSSGAGQPNGFGAPNPYASIFDGKSSTAEMSGGGGPAAGGPAQSDSTFGQSNLASHSAPMFGPPKTYGISTETKAQAEARGANLSGSGAQPNRLTATGAAGFDYSGSKNTGGQQVPGVSSAGPMVQNLQNPAWMTRR